MRNLLFVLTLLALAPAASAADLAGAIDRTVAAPPFDKAIWAIEIEEEDGSVLYARNAHTLVMPASNRKLFAAAAIANCLNWDGQLRTELWHDGQDLVLRGGGDPSLGGRFYSSPADALGPFVTAAREKGIMTVRDVIADVSAFDRVTVPHSWKIGNLPSTYSAPVDALTFAENSAFDGSVPEPGLFAAEAMRDALRAAGISVTGTVHLCAANCISGRGERVISVASPFVRDLLATVLKNSQNLYTEVLFKDLTLMNHGTAAVHSANDAAVPASYDAALELERRFLIDEAGVDGSEFRFADGSGLSTEDLVTPAAIIRLLRWIHAPERRAQFREVMATPGQAGTLRRRLVPLQTRLRAKTGTINGVSALSGFIENDSGRTRFFSIIVNHYVGDSSAAEQIIDAVVTAIADF